MKKFLLIASACLFALSAYSQAKKPTIMVVPGKTWCNENGYMKTYDNQGVEEYLPDYNAALLNRDLKPVIVQLNGLLADRGFEAKSMEATLASINRRSAETAAITSKSDASVKTNDYLELRQRAKADIVIEVNWSVNKIGPKSSITYTLEGLDAYTDNSIASATGTGAPSFSVETPVLLAQAVNAHMDEFCDRLQNHFDDLFEKGRAVSIWVRVFDNEDDIDMETEYGDMELREVIETWMADNTVSHRFNLVDDSEYHMEFTDVRIPLYDERGQALAANGFARQLIRYLRGEPCNIKKIKLVNMGLGQAQIVIGDK